jgi:isopenicillin N synthase-like dioxygenase
MSLAEKQGSVAPADIPVIDISGLATSGPAADAIVAAIGEACRRIGFFVVTGHGVPAATLTAAATNTRAFFALPVADKLALSIELSPHNRGYVRLQSETLNLDRPADEKEAFNIGLDLTPDDPEVVAGKRFRGVNVWPDLPGWRAGMLDYFDRNTRLGLALLSAFARDLGEPADRFRSWMERPSATLRLLRYPPQPPVAVAGRPGATERIGAGEHTDYGALTLLTQLDGGGLEVRRRDGQWVPVPVIPGSFVCNIGECLMRASNDVYVATPHRVISTSPAQRHSIAFFFDPSPDALIAPLASCVAVDRPARYRSVLFTEYLASRLDPTYGVTHGATRDG